MNEQLCRSHGWESGISLHHLDMWIRLVWK
jgi:hypothetical protein